MLTRYSSGNSNRCFKSPVLQSHHFNSVKDLPVRALGFWATLSGCIPPLPVTNVLPSGENDTDHTGPSKPLIALRNFPDSVFHNSTRLSWDEPLANASVRPSAEKRIA